MKINNILDAYKAYVRDGDLDRYVSACPSLFQHYFAFWGSKESFYASLTAEEATMRADRILCRLPAIRDRFQANGFSLDAIQMVLFVGQGVTNGHAFFDKDHWIVWIPVEAYETDKRIDVFITHEIIHALQYSADPLFYFSNKKEKERVGRQVMTEGVATYVTGKILGCTPLAALWADYLPEKVADTWLQQCYSRQQELYQYIYRLWDQSDEAIELFMANDSEDVFKFRAGYFAGQQLIEGLSIVKGLSLQEVLSTSRTTWSQWIGLEIGDRIV